MAELCGNGGHSSALAIMVGVATSVRKSRSALKPASASGPRGGRAIGEARICQRSGWHGRGWVSFPKKPAFVWRGQGVGWPLGATAGGGGVPTARMVAQRNRGAGRASDLTGTSEALWSGTQGR